MRDELLNFDIFPSVVPADKVTNVKIKAKTEYLNFIDEVKYYVSVCPMEIHDIPINDEFTLDGYKYKEFELYPKDGILEFKYKFIGEQKWCIRIRAGSEQYNYLDNVKLGYKKYWNLHQREERTRLYMYSLKEDLYNRRPLKGDLHLHTVFSDGNENPEIVVSNMRRFGNDFCAITDHRFFDSSKRAVEKLNELNTGFKAFLGEEVHENYDGRIHIINFGGQESINKQIMDNYDEFMKAVRDDEKNYPDMDEKEALQLAFHKIICDMIRKVGGLCIFAHPFWDVCDSYNTPINVVFEVFKRGYYDAFELMSGIEQDQNNIQLAVYNEMRTKGIKIPVVGSTDCHNTHTRGVEYAGNAHTLVFSDGDIKESITDGYSVAIECVGNQREHVYGDLRLSKYAIFLVDNYFRVRDRLTESSGVMMAEYYNGAVYLKPAIELMEKRIKEFEDNYFGR